MLYGYELFETSLIVDRSIFNDERKYMSRKTFDNLLLFVKMEQNVFMERRNE